MVEKNVQFVDARDLIAAQAGTTAGEQREWPHRCAVANVWFEVPSNGRLIKTRMVASFEVDANGKFDPTTRNPVVFYNTHDGQHTNCWLPLFVKGTNGMPVRREFKEEFDAIIPELDHHTPKRLMAPTVAQAENLGSPTEVEMPS